MNVKNMVMVAGFLSCAAAFGQAKENFMQQQAYAEMQRVSGQVDVLQANLSDVQRRVGTLEGGGDARSMRQEIESLKAAIADIRREMRAMRDDIVRDLTGRISKMQAAAPAQAPKPVEKRVVIGPHFEYVVKSGDTLSLIAEAFNTSVSKIKEMNNLKSDSLRVGQKLNVPK